MKKNRISISFFLTLFLSIAFITIFYGKILLSPNDYMFSNWGDGIKNYYTYAYHIRHDTSCINFQGMNYPYGEHILYTDNHPIFSGILKVTGSMFPSVNNHCIGILNLIIILSFVLSALTARLILTALKVTPFIAAISSLGMMALCPQVFRMGGHLALSYGFFVPLTIYLTLKGLIRDSGPLWRWLLFVNIMFWFYVHAYLGMMGISFVLSCWIFTYLFRFRYVKKEMKFYACLFLWVAIPVIVFVLFLRLTDIHTGRTQNPLGFFLSNSEPDDILVPTGPPLRPLIDIIVKVHQNWEAWSYIGLTSIIVLAVVIINLMLNFIRKRKIGINEKWLPGSEIRILLWSSLFLMVFAFGFPFKSWPGLLELVPVIKNFRATGRFNWFFFFIVNIMTAMILDQWLKNSRDSKGRIIIIVAILVALLFTFGEGLAYHKSNAKEIIRCKNLFLRENIGIEMETVLKNVNPGNYQAIIPLPFYYIGSENFSIEPIDASVRNSLVFSYHTGIPVAGARLTRTAISESRNIIQIISPDYYNKMIKNDIKSNKPFLILRTKEELSAYEEKLLSKGRFLNGDGSLGLFELPVNDLFQSSAASEFIKFESIRNSLFTKHGFLLSDSTGFITFNDYEDRQSDMKFSGNGAVSGNKKETTLLTGFDAGTFETGTEYSASMWMFNGKQDALNDWFRLIVEEFGAVNNQYFVTFVLPEQSESIDGNWSLVEIDFRVQNSKNYLAIKLKGKETDHAVFHLDDLLVRKKSTDVYRIEAKAGLEKTRLFKNNHRISD